jgi:hypothetical protein
MASGSRAAQHGPNPPPPPDQGRGRRRKPIFKGRWTEPGETRFWCSCDARHPFYSARELVEHVMEARAGIEKLS